MISEQFLSYVDRLEADHDKSPIVTCVEYQWRLLTERVDSNRALRLVNSIVDTLVMYYQYAPKYIFNVLRDTHVQKNSAYNGNNPDPWNNFRRCHKDFGIDPIEGILARMCDKMSRYENLRDDLNIDDSGEKITDTLTDLASYAIILACLLDERDNSAALIEGMKEAHG